MLYRVAAFLAIVASASACDEAKFTECNAAQGVIDSSTSNGYCTYINDMIGCIGTAGCCEDQSVKDALSLTRAVGDLAGYNCDYATCTNAAPCFSKDTLAIDLNGDSIPMSSLRSGDYVMDGPDSFTRVIVNQHAQVSIKSSLLEINAGAADVSLTPDHVLEVDGKMSAARTVVLGSKLGDLEVSRVTSTSGDVINPLTASGKILTQGGILASTYPEWVAEYMLSSRLFPLPISLSNLLSYLFPEATQKYYDAVIEGFVNAHHPMHLKAALPHALLPLAFLLGDLAVSAGFVGFNLASAKGLFAIVAIVCTAAAIKANKK